MMDPAGFVRANTVIAAPPLVPEIRLHLATEVTPLWQATEEALARSGTPPPFWAFAWAGGQALARYLLDHPEVVAGRHVLDFGSGSGLVAIAAAKAGAQHVLAAEIDPFAAAAIAANAALNEVAVAVATGDLIDTLDPSWGVVTAGDVCYEQPMAGRVTIWLRRLAAEKKLVLLGDPGRAYRPTASLCERARYRVPTSRELEDQRSPERGGLGGAAGLSPLVNRRCCPHIAPHAVCEPARLYRPPGNARAARAGHGAGRALSRNDRDPDPASGRGRTRGPVRKRLRRRRRTPFDAGACQSLRHRRAGRLGHGPRSRTNCARSVRRWHF